MSFSRVTSSTKAIQGASRAVRHASTSTSSTVRKSASSTYNSTPKTYSSATTTARRTPLPRAISSSGTTSKTSPPAASAQPTYSSSSTPSFDDIDPSPARSTETINPRNPTRSPPPPLTSFPDENYTSLPDASGPAPQGGDWETSTSGLSFQPFPSEVAKVLMRDLEPHEVEVKPDGILFMPEIRYRKRLNEAFGPGGWGMAPRGASQITENQVSREWGLVCLGRLVAVARGESDFFDKSGITTAHESSKSNALMRCCKDLGIAADLWDPTFIRQYKQQYVTEVWAAHVKLGTKKKLFRKKTDPKFTGTWKE